MMKTKPIIVGLGEILWDLLPDGKVLGGAPANVACHAGRLGGESYVVSAVGKDKPGREILHKLKRMGLKSEYISVDVAHPTGIVTVKLDKIGVPDFTIHTGVAWDYIPWNDNLHELAKKADAICFGSLAQRLETSRKTIRNFLLQSKKECLRIFDVNLRQSFFNKEILKESLKISDFFKLNDDELPVISKMFSANGSEHDISLKILDEFNLKLIAVTKGSKGSSLYTRDEVSSYKVPEVNVVDTVGAGDAFTAVLIMGLLRGLPLKKIHENATEIAAFVCTQKGATPKLPVNYITKFMNF